jgi:hypothetical protein
LLLAVLALAPAPARADETVLKVIPLKNRPAADLVPVLAPIAGPEGSVTALETRLVVRATPQALARIEALLRTLDTPLRSLVISVSQGVATTSAGQSAGVGGGVSTGSTTVVVPPRSALPAPRLPTTSRSRSGHSKAIPPSSGWGARSRSRPSGSWALRPGPW